MNINEQWDEQAELYHAYLNETSRVSSSKVFPQILNHFGDLNSLSILDFGCGEGRFARVFADNGGNVTAYDPSEKELKLAQLQDNGRGIHYTSDLSSLPQNSSHRAICFMVLICNPEKEAKKLIQDIYDLMKPGGVVCFANTNTDTLGRRFADFYSTPPTELAEGTPYTSYIPTSKGKVVVTDHYYTPSGLSDMFIKANFEIIDVEIISDQFVLHTIKKAL